MALLLTSPIIIGLIVMFIWFALHPSKDVVQLQDHISALISSHGWSRGTIAPLLPMLERLGYYSQTTLLEGELDGQRFWFYESLPSPSGPIQLNEEHKIVTLLTVSFPQEFPDLLIIPVVPSMPAGSPALDAENLSAPAKHLIKMVDDKSAQAFGLVPLELEGDFNLYMHVYGQQGQEIDVLTYLSPDVMAVIQDRIKSIVLLSGNYLSVTVNTTPDKPITGDALDTMLHDTEMLLGEIRQKPVK